MSAYTFKIEKKKNARGENEKKSQRDLMAAVQIGCSAPAAKRERESLNTSQKSSRLRMHARPPAEECLSRDGTQKKRKKKTYRHRRGSICYKASEDNYLKKKRCVYDNCTSACSRNRKKREREREHTDGP